MRLVEVVVLMGAHCISPVEHSQLMTEAAKVQCAVVVEKDTDRGTLRVTPETASADPRVAAAVAHLTGVAQRGARIVPAGAPPATATLQLPRAASTAAPAQPAIAPPTDDRVQADGEIATPEVPTAPDGVAEPATQKVVAAPPAEKAENKPRGDKSQAQKAPAPVKLAEAQPKQGGHCKGAAVPKWYKTPDGHRKYRCVRPVPTSDTPPATLY